MIKLGGVALLFVIKFTQTNLLMSDVQNSNLSKIVKRLELIKSLISLEEQDVIDGYIRDSNLPLKISFNEI